MNLKIEIKIINTDTEKVIWSDFCSGTSEYQRGMFESAEMSLGSMERHLPQAVAEETKADEPDFAEDDNEASREKSQTEGEAFRNAN